MSLPKAIKANIPTARPGLLFKAGKYQTRVHIGVANTEVVKRQKESWGEKKNRKRCRPRGLNKPSRANPGTHRAALNTRAYCSHSSHLTSSLRAAVRFIPAAYHSTQKLPAFTYKKNRGCDSSYSLNLVFCTPPQWEPPGLQSLRHHGTTALLYRASRRVLNPAVFPTACVRSICFPASLSPPHQNSSTMARH